MQYIHYSWHFVDNVQSNTLKPRQNGRYFADYIFKCIFLNENVWILIDILQYSSIGSDNGLAPTRQQAIIWTNDT